jgi:hypothetical protein
MATRHTCNDGNGPYFGRKTSGCPRCDQLLAGAAPVVQTWRNERKENEKRFETALRAHDCRTSNCGPVCTFGEW